MPDAGEEAASGAQSWDMREPMFLGVVGKAVEVLAYWVRLGVKPRPEFSRIAVPVRAVGHPGRVARLRRLPLRGRCGQ